MTVPLGSLACSPQRMAFGFTPAWYSVKAFCFFWHNDTLNVAGLLTTASPGMSYVGLNELFWACVQVGEATNRAPKSVLRLGSGPSLLLTGLEVELDTQVRRWGHVGVGGP